MNLTKLFEIQRKLDDHIEMKHLTKEGEDRLAKKILALLGGLGELCNCWRGFKYWSDNQKLRTLAYNECPCGTDYCSCDEYGCSDGPLEHSPFLEEYVDCLHFILSIGLELNFTDIDVWKVKEATITNQFIECFGIIYSIHFQKRVNGEVPRVMYEHLFAYFIGLGEMLGFNWYELGMAKFTRLLEEQVGLTLCRD